jgi:short subunit dehydrogenase-like uncharacterized protein
MPLNNDMSRGTAKTMIEAIAAGTRLRPNGRIVTRDWAEEGSCDFGQGEKPTTQVSWGDVATAFHSTGIPNIEVHFDASPAIRAFARMPWLVKSFFGLGFMQSLLKFQVDSLPEGPSEAARRTRRAVLVGQARNKMGQTARSRLRTPEGYSLTAATALDAARRVYRYRLRLAGPQERRTFSTQAVMLRLFRLIATMDASAQRSCMTQRTNLRSALTRSTNRAEEQQKPTQNLTKKSTRVIKEENFQCRWRQDRLR